MTLLTKLEDSEEGLIGFTEEGKHVHLGKPTMYTELHDLGYNSFQMAVGTFSPDFIEKLQKDKIEENNQRSLDFFRKDDKAYWYFETSSACNRSSTYSHAYSFLRFDLSKEEAYQRDWETKYGQSEVDGTSYIKLHRALA
jgi:hypothetical protein